MMTYTAPDGHIIESKPYPEQVVYSCPCTGIPDGIYDSVETTSSADSIGIKQIKIKRVVENNNMTITLIMSSSQELQDYITANTQ